MAATLEDALLAVLDEVERGRRVTREWLDARFPRWADELAGALEVKERLQGRLGPYRCVEEIGRGGMGTVYLAVAPDGTEVALKVVHRALLERPGLLTRLLNEAEACRDLEQENVVRTLDLGTVERDGQRDFYLVFERLEGRTLRERLEAEGPLPEADCLAVADSVAAALEAIHARGALHLDLKPENVFETRDGTLKVMDFGVARLAQEPALDAPDGVFAGTLMYAAPEQFHAARRHLDARADLYSLGVLLFELATGRLPDDGEAPGVSRFFDRIVRTLLSLEPDDRFASARELRAALAARQWTGRSDFVGRAAELRALHDALERGGAVLIEGEAGAGKTRLLEEFLADATDAGYAVARGPRLRAIALAHAGSGLLRGAPALAEALRGGAPTPEELDAALARIARGMAAAGPAVIAVEDLHAAGAAEARAFAALGRAVQGRRALLVGTTRRGTDEPGAERLVLGRLEREELADLARRTGHDPARAPRLHEISGGHPLFARLVLDAWGDGDDRAGTPRAVEDLVRARVAALPAGPRRFLDAAACLGRIDGPLLGRALGAEAGDGDVFGGELSHDLFREVAASMLDEDARRPLHAALARALPEGAERTLHRLLAGENVSPETALAAAAELGTQQRDEEALRLLELAEPRMPERDRAELLRERARALEGLGQLDAAARTLEEAVRRTADGSDPGLAARVRTALVALLTKLSRYADARRVAHDAFARARRAADDDAECGALAGLGEVLLFLGRGRKAEAVSRRLRRRAARAFGRVPAGAYQTAAKVAKVRGRPDEAMRFFEEGLRAAELPADRDAVMMIEGHYALLLMGLGRFDEARERARRSARLAHESGRRYAEAMVLGVLCELNERQGRLREALADVDRRIGIFEELGALDGIVRAETMRMQVAFVWNDRALFERARARTDALRDATETYAFDLVRELLLAEWALRDGDTGGARAGFERGLGKAEEIRHNSGAACARYGLGRCLLESDPDAGRVHLEHARSIGEQTRNADVVAATDLLLAEAGLGDAAAAVARFRELAPRVTLSARIENLLSAWRLTRDDQTLLEGRRLVHALQLDAPEKFRAGLARRPDCAAILAESTRIFGTEPGSKRRFS